MRIKVVVKFKILFHFIKGKIFLTIMETIIIILGELEYLQGLVKLVIRNVEVQRNQIIVVHATLTIRRVSVNKANCSKTLHLVVEINQALIESLLDTRVSISVMASIIVRELSIMHLVVGHETYMRTSSIVTHALGRIIKFHFVIIQMGACIIQWLILNRYNTHNNHKQVLINDPYGYRFKFYDLISVIFDY